MKSRLVLALDIAYTETHCRHTPLCRCAPTEAHRSENIPTDREYLLPLLAGRSEVVGARELRGDYRLDGLLLQQRAEKQLRLRQAVAAHTKTHTYKSVSSAGRRFSRDQMHTLLKRHNVCTINFKMVPTK